MFYGALLDLPSVHGSQHPDVLFVHGNGNDRLAALAKTLTALDVKVGRHSRYGHLKRLGLV